MRGNENLIASDSLPVTSGDSNPLSNRSDGDSAPSGKADVYSRGEEPTRVHVSPFELGWLVSFFHF